MHTCWDWKTKEASEPPVDNFRPPFAWPQSSPQYLGAVTATARYCLSVVFNQCALHVFAILLVLQLLLLLLMTMTMMMMMMGLLMVMTIAISARRRDVYSTCVFSMLPIPSSSRYWLTYSYLLRIEIAYYSQTSVH